MQNIIKKYDKEALVGLNFSTFSIKNSIINTEKELFDSQILYANGFEVLMVVDALKKTAKIITNDQNSYISSSDLKNTCFMDYNTYKSQEELKKASQVIHTLGYSINEEDKTISIPHNKRLKYTESEIIRLAGYRVQKALI